MQTTRSSKSERGQAIILIVFAMIGMIAITALTVDGSNAYSDRRHAQNAADTSVLAAARAKIRQENWKNAALAIALENGYNDTDSSSASSSTLLNVEVYRCDENGIDCEISLKAGEALEDFIQVKITAITQTYFAGIIGVHELTNVVSAVAKVKEGTETPIASGSAVYSLNPSGCQSVTYQGNAAVTLIGAGIYVNSSCPQSAFFNNSNSPGLTAPCLQAVGGIQYVESSVNITTPNCILSGQPVIPPPTMPQITCSGNAVKNGNILSPGNISGSFPPNGVTILQSGVYCVDAGNQNFTLNANDILTGHDVTIYMKTGGITWNGQATVRLDAPDTGPYKGLLIFVDPANSNPVSISGGGDSKIVGTIMAPASQCDVLGGGGQEGLQSQLVCYDVKLGGGSNTTLVYNPEVQYQPPSPPTIELTR